MVLLIVLSGYALLIISSNHYARLTADATIYLDLAKKYLQGDYTNAVNGYWGPMLAWLFIPFLYFGAGEVFAINALNLVIGLLTIFGVWSLSYRFEISEIIRIAILASLLPIMLLFSVVEIFDFLLVCFIVYYLNIVFNNKYQTRLSGGILCGFFGALAYFSKSFAFPFFIVHFFAMNIFHFIRCSAKERTKVLRNAVAGFAVFVIIIAPWVYALSTKYGKFTFSNTGKGNFASIGPDDPETGLERGVSIFHQGLFAPPNKTATSIWEDPSYIWKDVSSWSPLDSPKHFKHFLKNTARNLFDTIMVYESFSRLAVTIVVAYILLIITGPFNREMLRADMLYSFVTVAIYSGGYLPFHLEHRYLWLVNILLLLMGGHLLHILFRNDYFNKPARRSILLVIFAISFMITPLKSYAQSGGHNINKDMYIFSHELKDKFQIKGNIASNREWVHEPVHDSWHKTFRISYWLNSRYFGQTRAVLSEDELSEELKKHNIEYFFIWGETQSIPEVLSQYNEITNGVYTDLKIYSIMERPE